MSPLDRPIWSALSASQSEFAVGGELARRYAPDIGPLASTRDDETASLAALAELVASGGPLILLQADPITLPGGVKIETAAAGVQMIAEELAPAPRDARIERLTREDWPAMLALAKLTKPGPFEIGTPKLGEFWGIKESGVLLAMAGERMRFEGHAEVSGVCSHPEARGRGYARALSAFVASRIVGRGERPFLHAYASNTPAIRLYESLGFRVRSAMHVAVITARPE